MSADLAIMLVWVAFLVTGSAAALAVFLWGVRSGQFGDQERARSLPLEAAIPDERGEEPGEES